MFITLNNAGLTVGSIAKSIILDWFYKILGYTIELEELEILCAEILFVSLKLW
jgi:hypothetical protein